MMGIAVAAWIETHSHGIPKVQRSKSLPSKRPLKGPQIDVKDLRRWVPSSFWPSTRYAAMGQLGGVLFAAVKKLSKQEK